MARHGPLRDRGAAQQVRAAVGRRRDQVAFTLTEPTAGTGADLRCSVVREGDTYYLSGEKHLITFGTICDYWLLFARLAGTRGAEGTVALLVDRTPPDATVVEMERVDGRARHRPRAPVVRSHARFRSRTASATKARGCEVALGGFLTPSRISVAMSCVGLARRAHELAIEYAGTARDVRQDARAAPGDLAS